MSRFVILIIMCLMAGTVYGQAVLYVDGTADGADDGTSWCDAYRYLQDALSDAEASGGSVKKIFVAQGFYKPDQGAGQAPGDREAKFELLTGVTLRGGFAGCWGADPDARNISDYETILSGDLGDNDMGDIDDPSHDENSYTVVFCDSCDQTTVLDGFTISGGNTPGVGGGMYNSNGGPMLAACTFTSNAASFGGGIANFTGGSPKLTGCTFIGNVARSSSGGGGAIYNYDGSSPTLKYCLFIANSADAGLGGGGAVRNSTGSDPVLTNCAFAGNLAVYGGGMMNVNSSPTMINCTFAANLTPVMNGRALAFASPGPVSTSHAVLINCILWDNGLEILNNDDSTITITYSDILGGWPGTGNIDADPLFAAGPGGDYYLCQAVQAERSIVSPCVDAGDPFSEMIYGTTRIDEVPDTGPIDMGYHYPTDRKYDPGILLKKILD